MNSILHIDKDASICVSKIQVNDDRELVVRQIEESARNLISDGTTDEWFRDADESIKQVSCLRSCTSRTSIMSAQVTQGVNGPLLEELARNIDYHDTACVEMFREGADIAGTLEYAGNGWPAFLKDAEDLKKLDDNRQENNLHLLRRMREDTHSQTLYWQAVEEVELGRASCPRPLTYEDVCKYSFGPRFGVEQGDFQEYLEIPHVACLV